MADCPGSTRAQQAASAKGRSASRSTSNCRAAEDLTQLRAALAAAEQAVLTAEQARARARDAVTAAQATLNQARAVRAAWLQAEADRHLLEELKAAAQALLSAADASASPT